MHNLQDVLTDYFSGSETQTAFSARVSIERGALNRAVKGTKRAGIDLATRIISGLPQDWQPRAAAAWLADQAVGDLRNLVSILPNKTQVREEAPRLELPHNLAADVRDDVIWLATRAMLHPEIRQLIAAIRKSLSSN